MSDSSPGVSPLFTVCVLFYGNSTVEAARVLRSLQTVPPGADTPCTFRFGLNQPSAELTALVQQEGEQFCPQWYLGSPPYYKYPLMRKMFHEKPLTSKYVMWFDDDSWIHEDAPADWWSRVAQAMESADMVGSIWTCDKTPRQREYIAKQTWFTGRCKNHPFRFATGGWWVIRTAILQQYDWPPDIEFHRGGDTMLGELLRQQGLRLVRFEQHVTISGNKKKAHNTAPRRGASKYGPTLGNF